MNPNNLITFWNDTKYIIRLRFPIKRRLRKNFMIGSKITIYGLPE